MNYDDTAFNFNGDPLQNGKESQNVYPTILLEDFQKGFRDIEEKLNQKGSPSKNGKYKPKRFFKEIFDNLPDILRFGCETFTDDIEKEVFLVGAIGVISGILPNIQGFYDGKYYSPNLYCYILANYGTGKGGLNLCRYLANPIHISKKERHTQKKEQYEKDLLEYEKQLKLFNNGNLNAEDLLEPPQVPNLQLLFIPANNSKTGAFELLANSDGKGIIFETEGDTVADTLKQDYGNYSDGFRKAFHHETISYYRRTGKELVEIENPCLSVVLSSTYDQLLNLIPSVENGLFSRFLFYHLEGSTEFKNVFDPLKSDYPKRLSEMGEILKKLHDNLDALNEPINIELTQKQKAKFLSVFESLKKELNEYMNEGINGTVNRLGLICFRIAIILTVLRHSDGQDLKHDILNCKDVDFENALLITDTLKDHALYTYYRLPENNSKASKKEDPKQKEARELREEGKSYGNIAKELRRSKSTIHKWCNS